ncbi:unnamed protein product [Brachionus calyciflorus]|uniref:MULE transposase domain-containing protein n=1 Tax=Brachionus calyciflorus TaxID=104777 RepID=A0A814JWK5_9BILA|nr:unnamed protein product [Brachionus calyciflorus]
MFNCSWKVVDLQAECKKLKLSYAWKKSNLVKRLNNYTKDVQSAETGALSDSVKSQDEHDHTSEKYSSGLKAIYNYEFKPEILIADGAEAITNGFINAFNYKSIDEFNLVMCWAHVHRAIDTRTKSIDESLRSQIRTDINLIQLSPSPEHFRLLCTLFTLKWSKKDPIIDNFFNYFESEWVNSRNNGWYEGLSVNIPSTDNGLESINGKIKLIHTLRTRLSVNAYLSNLENMLRHWSKDTLKEKIFVESVSFSQQSWKLEDFFMKKIIPAVGKSSTDKNNYTIVKFA